LDKGQRPIAGTAGDHIKPMMEHSHAHLSFLQRSHIQACLGVSRAMCLGSAGHAFRARFTSLHEAGPRLIRTIYGSGSAAESRGQLGTPWQTIIVRKLYKTWPQRGPALSMLQYVGSAPGRRFTKCGQSCSSQQHIGYLCCRST
jgi:hypothetical protein